MSVGDKVIFQFIQDVLDTSINCRQQGCLPMVGHITAETSPTDVIVVWPTGEAPEVPDSTLFKIFDVADFGNEAAASWGFDVGKYVQITEYPIAGVRAAVASESPGSVVPPQSPAASGIVSLVLALGGIGKESPDLLAAWIAVQDGKKHIAVIGIDGSFSAGVPPFAKPYVEQPGRRAVGFG
jgi:hypothetical protein